MTWDELEQNCADCKKCALGNFRTKPVFGTGIRSSEILFVGEGPGEQEDLSGEPFVGPAGKLLDDMLRLINLDRTKNIYIANIVKCRPPANRDPKPEEQTACIGWLREQYKLIRPKLVICLGRIAACALIKDDFKISREHGKWFDISGVKFMAMYHPSALLRNPSLRPETFEDLMELDTKIKESDIRI